jgi:Zn-dependent protease with chaperone function
MLFFELGGERLTNRETDKKFGKYAVKEILSIVDKQCQDMGVTSVKRVYVMKSSVSNAMTTDVILFKPFRFSILILYSNVFDILNQEELSAIIGHEVAHVKNYDSWYLGMVGNPSLMMLFVIIIWFESVTSAGIYFSSLYLLIIAILIVFYIIIRPLVKRMVRYCEYYADFTSAKINGTIPTINALIKIGQRHDMLIAFQHEFQRRFRLDWKFKSSNEFYKRLRDELKYVIDTDDAILIARKLVLEFGGKEIDNKKTMDKGFLIFKPKIINWLDYDNHIRDYSLDCIELEQLIRDLKDSPQARLFEHASTNNLFAIFQSHPRIKERLIFLWDARKDVYKTKYEDILLISTAVDLNEYVERKFICPVCQTKFKAKTGSKTVVEIHCPGCRIPGELKIRI